MSPRAGHARPRLGRGATRGRILRRLRHRPAHRPRRDGCAGAAPAGDRARDVGHGRRARRRSRRLPARRRGGRSTARLPRRDAGGPRLEPHQPQPQVPRDRRARRAPAVMDRPRLYPPCASSTVDLRLGALAEPLAVACHDVRRARCGRPARARDRRRPDRAPDRARRARRGARVRRRRAGEHEGRRELGFEVARSRRGRLAARVLEESGGAGADVVFEVSGSAAGMLARPGMPACAAGSSWSRSSPSRSPSALFDVFFKELDIRGVRVYEPEDFDARSTCSRPATRSRAADHRRRAARARPRAVRGAPRGRPR